MTPEKHPIINYDRCDRCGKCIELCPEDALQMRKKGPTIKQPNLCTYCTTCEEVCPQKAIRAPYSISWA